MTQLSSNIPLPLPPINHLNNVPVHVMSQHAGHPGHGIIVRPTICYDPIPDPRSETAPSCSLY